MIAIESTPIHCEKLSMTSLGFEIRFSLFLRHAVSLNRKSDQHA
jgi:hypothetical protein